MFELTGKYNTAKVFSNQSEDSAVSQLITLLNQEFVKDSKIRIMPDYHAGAGCVIGTTMEIKDKVVPNLVGVDIGCGMFVVELGDIEIDLVELDKFIRQNIPHGFSINEDRWVEFNKIKDVICLPHLKKDKLYFEKSIGSLGGGNHFIEINVDSKGNKYLVIHSGSRNFGLQIANYYQNEAIKNLKGKGKEYQKEQERIIDYLKSEGKQREIPDALNRIKLEFHSDIPDELCYVEGESFDNYLHDLNIAQEYALFNREMMAVRILEFLELGNVNYWHTIHNYIDLEKMILRKGAVSARFNELLIIPINMRDGSILAKGKGNPDWNFSAPHGAGRLMSRGQAKEQIKMKDFKESMEGIYTTSVKQSTLDEAPFAYKSLEDILENISETVEVLEVIKPIYNFKA